MNGGHGLKIDHYLAQIRNVDQFTGIGSVNMQTKICSKCRETKPLDDFHKGSGAFKRESMCKDCKRVYIRERYRNSELVKERQKKYNLTINGKITRANKDHYYRNGSKDGITIEDWLEILKLQGNQCVLCNRSFDEVKPTFDCIIPLSKGGRFTKDNVQALCKTCNAKKNAKILKIDRFNKHKYPQINYFLI